jgi:glutamine amidotransferase
MKNFVVIVDLQLGNIQSLCAVLSFLGLTYVVSNDENDIELASHIILPGVGAFDSAMQRINEFSLIDPLKRNILIEKKPILGICLGMQILFKKSEEGKLPGLGILDAELLKLKASPGEGIKVPHVGFNSLFGQSETEIFEGLGSGSFFYFTHSYAVVQSNEKMNIAFAHHGQDFIAAFQKDNICGVQFHPEKSQSTGLKLISNFFRI